MYDANVDRVEGPLCFDLDDGGLAVAEANCKAMGLAACCYSTYNHSETKEKARLVVFLSQSIPTRTVEQAQAYSEFYDALGEIICNNRHDTSCRNVARVIYLPANDGVRPKFAHFIPGGLYDPRPLLEKVSAGDRAGEGCARARSDLQRAQRAAAGACRVSRGQGATYTTRWLGAVPRHVRQRFNAADFLKRVPVDRKAQRRPLGGAASYCPFGDEHTDKINKSDALWALNASAAGYGVFVFECAHATCKAKRHGGHFLDALITMHKLGRRDVLEFVDLTPAERAAMPPKVSK